MSEVTLDWASGAGAQIEVFSPSANAGTDYRVKYTPPFRSTIRPPLQPLQLGPGELDPLNTALDQVVQTAEGARGPAGAAAPPDGAVESQLMLSGNMLFDLIVPPDVAVDLRKPGLFLEFGVDDELVQYPWELMHDGDDYIALKHYIGRYVNSTVRTTLPFNASGAIGAQKLKILLVCASNPVRNVGDPIPRLPAAEKEAEDLFNLFTGLPGVEVRLLKNNTPGMAASYSNVFQALKDGCHIFHYTGHAYFDENKDTSYKSSLVLWDKDMSTGHLSKFIGNKKAPVFCFVNGCESALSQAWGKSYNIFSLAQAFLSTGAYLLGSRWKLADREAADFAVAFYTALLQDKKSIGEATLLARKKLRESGPSNSFSWASYVLYADPRVCFKYT